MRRIKLHLLELRIEKRELSSSSRDNNRYGWAELPESPRDRTVNGHLRNANIFASVDRFQVNGHLGRWGSTAFVRNLGQSAPGGPP